MKISFNLKLFKIITIISVIVHPSSCQFNSSICVCVPSGSCNGNSGGDGSNQIDVRIISGGISPGNPTPPSIISPVSSGLNPVVISQNFCQYGLERCCLQAFTCGVRYPPVSQARPPTPGSNQAVYGAYPWQGVILAAADSSYQGSGLLIDHFHFLTAAHKIVNFVSNGQQLKVRLGEWDASSSTEPIPAQEFFVSRIFIHPGFNPTNLRNSIAILRFSSPVTLGQVPTITTGCLPSIQISNTRCWVAGWGKSDFQNGAFQAIQKEVEVPIVEQNLCQNLLRATRLGSNFQLDFQSFMCAGGEFGRDACVGDGGSPLMCKFGNNWFAAGLVAWGIGCGSANVPGVYMNIFNYLGWIQQTTISQ